MSLKWINASQVYYYFMMGYLILEALCPVHEKVEWSANVLSRACMLQILFIDQFTPQFLYFTLYFIIQYLVSPRLYNIDIDTLSVIKAA